MSIILDNIALKLCYYPGFHLFYLTLEKNTVLIFVLHMKLVSSTVCLIAT